MKRTLKLLLTLIMLMVVIASASAGVVDRSDPADVLLLCSDVLSPPHPRTAPDADLTAFQTLSREG